MLKNIKFMMLMLFCTVLSANTDLRSEAPISATIDLWGNKVSEIFHKLISKELLSFGKSDRASTTKNELLERANVLKESLGGFVKIVKESVDEKKPEHANDKKHEKHEKHEEPVVAATPSNTPAVSVEPASPAVSVAPVAPAPVAIVPAPAGPAQPAPAVAISMPPAPVEVPQVAAPVSVDVPAAPVVPAPAAVSPLPSVPPVAPVVPAAPAAAVLPAPPAV